MATVSFVKYLVSAYNYNLDFGTSAVDLKKTFYNSILGIMFMYISHFQFGKVLQYYGHHQVFLDRPITLLVPTNEAMLKYKGKRHNIYISEQ